MPVIASDETITPLKKSAAEEEFKKLWNQRAKIKWAMAELKLVHDELSDRINEIYPTAVKEGWI